MTWVNIINRTVTAILLVALFFVYNVSGAAASNVTTSESDTVDGELIAELRDRIRETANEIYFSQEQQGQVLGVSATGDRIPSPTSIKQIHSGHSLTDTGVFAQPWPGHFLRMLQTVDSSTDFYSTIGKSTIPGSPMSWRWTHAPGYDQPDARADIADWELLVITESVPFFADQYFQGESLDHMRLFTENAWNNGNNGQGADTLLYATWTGLENGEVQWRQELDDYRPRWEQIADYGAANLPAQAKVFIIPGNLMMARVYDDIQNGTAPFDSIRDLFMDDIHPNGIGSYGLGLMHAAVIHHIDPHTFAESTYELSPAPNQAQRDYFKDIVWEIAQNYERAGVPGGTITPPPPPSPTDTDGDGVADSSDNCPLVANANQRDSDGDGIGDVCDPTPNGDVSSPFSTGDRVETTNTLNVRDPYGLGGAIMGTQSVGAVGTVLDIPAQSADGYTWIAVDFDSGVDGWVASEFLRESITTPLPTDTDNDGVADSLDNCPFNYNPDQADNDNDGIGNVCDSTPNGDPTPNPDPGPVGDPGDYYYEVTQGTDQASSVVVSDSDQSVDRHGFRFFCVPTHFSYDDPVVYPGEQGRAHLHTFFGNTAVDYTTTVDSIISEGRSSCDGGITNRSAYWVPALFTEDGNPVLPDFINLYYKSWASDRSTIQPIPQGLQILANDQVQGSGGVYVGPRENPDGSLVEEQFGKAIGITDHEGFTIAIAFPDCVAVDTNGDPILTSEGGTSHVAYGGGDCPPSHPYHIPQLTQNVHYSIDAVPFYSDWYLASDFDKDGNRLPQGSTSHADYVAGWTVDAAQDMADFVAAAYHMSGPTLHSPDWDTKRRNSAGEIVYDYFTVASGADPTPDAMNGWPVSLHNMPMPDPDPQPTDTDNDGIADSSDNCPFNYNPDQADNDNDGIGNVCDSTPNGDPTPTSPFAAGDRVQTTDTVNVRDPYGLGGSIVGTQTIGAVGTVLAGVPQVADGYTWIAVDFDNGADGWVATAFLQQAIVTPQPVDTDADGITDTADNCPFNYNPDQADSDNDGIGNVCDSTPNGDTTPGEWYWSIFGIEEGGTYSGDMFVEIEFTGDVTIDNVLFRIDGDRINREYTEPYYLGGDNFGEPIGFDTTALSDGEHTLRMSFRADRQRRNVDYTFYVDNGSVTPDPDPQPTDTDGDGVPDISDNCPTVYNPTQADDDDDGIGSACDSTNDTDTDGDGVRDLADNCPTVANATQKDTDGDGIGDACDSTPNGDSTPTGDVVYSLNSLSPDGTGGSYLTLPHKSEWEISSGVVEFQFQVDSNGGIQNLLGKSDPYLYQIPSFNLRVMDGLFHVYMVDAKGRTSVGSVPVTAGDWHTVRYEFSPSKVTITLDGSFVLSATRDGSWVNNKGALQVGGSEWSDGSKTFYEVMNGTIRNLTITKN